MPMTIVEAMSSRTTFEATMLYAWIKFSPAPTNDDNQMIVLDIHGMCTGSQFIPGRLEPGDVVLISEMMHQLKDFTWSIKMTFCARHSPLSEKIIVQMDLLNPSLRMKWR
jgi:hypothetical protein